MHDLRKGAGKRATGHNTKRGGFVPRRDPRAFGRKPQPSSVRRVPCALLAAGIAAMIAALGLTFTDAKPAAPFFVGLLAFALILTAILSLKEE